MYVPENSTPMSNFANLTNSDTKNDHLVLFSLNKKKYFSYLITVLYIKEINFMCLVRFSNNNVKRYYLTWCMCILTK